MARHAKPNVSDGEVERFILDETGMVLESGQWIKLTWLSQAAKYKFAVYEENNYVPGTMGYVDCAGDMEVVWRKTF